MGSILIKDNTTKHMSRFVCLLMVIVFIQGCTANENDDLFDYVAQVKSRKAKKIPPLPEFKAYETYAYKATDLRDPFEAAEQQAAIGESGTVSQLRPNDRRNKEALESYPLDALHFVGHLEKDGKKWAIVTSPDNMVHRITVGNYIGQNFGKVVDIQDDRIEIDELVQDARGGWVERTAALTLTE